MTRVKNTTTECQDILKLSGALGLPVGHMVIPGSIEAQEAQGQKDFVVSTSLPVRVMPDRAAFEALGFTFGEPFADDPIFCPGTLPEGWSKRGTRHSMWSEIVDEAGTVRASVFYKAAFYDRSTFMKLEEKP